MRYIFLVIISDKRLKSKVYSFVIKNSFGNYIVELFSEDIIEVILRIR